ncbi:MAG: CPBP family intramembrane glutamic endopeptidase, partial [Solirubrobacteraceae bacterium]
GAARPWSELGLVPPAGLRAWASALLVIVIAALSGQQARAIGRASPERLDGLRDTLAGVGFLLPHTRGEARGFAALSVTAGVCEELLYRGFLVWVLKPFVGVVGALALGVLLFAVGHAYQGWRGMLKTGAAGAVMSAVVLGTGWLIPAMVVHAFVDLNAGVLGFAVLGERERPVATTAAGG